jgi:L-amino acid N-acyltransferase YncA
VDNHRTRIPGYNERMAVSIELMTPQDWPDVLSIYLEGIATRNATFETDAPDWEKWDARHLSECRLVARNHDRVIGWAALSRVSGRPVYAGVAEVSVYVARHSWSQGVGKGLLKALVAASEAAGIWTLQGSIFPENQASLALHKACGFRQVGRRERVARLDDRWRDTILLERRSRVTGV